MNDPRVELVAPGPVDIAALVEQWYGNPPTGVRANMVTSLDGEAAFAGRVQPISGPVDQELLTTLRVFADVVLVGAGTARAEQYGPVVLSDKHREMRERWGASTPPPIAIVTSSGTLPAQSRLAGASPAPLIITTTRAGDKAADSGAEVIAAGDTTVDLPAAIAELRRRGMSRILCEGGPTLLAELVAHDLVDELCLTVAPKFAGVQPQSDRAGGSTSLAMPRSLTLAHTLVHENFLYLRYSR